MDAAGKACDAMQSCIAASQGSPSMASPLGACAEPLLCTPRHMISRSHRTRRSCRSRLARSHDLRRSRGVSGHVKFRLTDHQVLRLLCVLGQRRLCTVRSIQSAENAHEKRNPAHRTVGASASCRRRHGRLRDCFPVCDGDGVVRNAVALTISSAALVTGSRMIPVA